MISEEFESTIRSNEMIVGEHLAGAWSKAMANSDELTDTDLIVIDAYLRREWLNNVRNEVVAQLGFSSPTWDSNASVRKWVFGYLGNETSLRWWRNLYGNTDGPSMAPELRDAINELLQAQGIEHHLSNKKRIAGMRPGPLEP